MVKIILFICLLLIKTIVGEEFCTLGKDCKCTFEDGQGYDLTGLNGDKFLEARDWSAVNSSYYLRLCGDTTALPPLKNNSDTCSTGYSLCSFSNNSFALMGLWSGVSSKSDKGGLLLTYTLDSKITATLQLVCTPANEDKKFFFDSNSDNQAQLILYSNNACKRQIYEIHGYGFFSILFIILITFGIAYLAMGIFVRFFLVGARGLEVIPNLDFWQKLGTSIRMGFLFVKNGCRTVPTDDSYDAI